MASASASVTAPRSPPQRMTMLNRVPIRWLRPALVSRGKNPHSMNARATSDATIITVSVTTSDQPMSTSNRGTSSAARTNTSEFAQYASCSHRSRRNRQARGRDARRRRRAHHESRRHRGRHARHREAALADDVDEIRQRERHRRLREAQVLQPRQQADHQARPDVPDRETPRERPEEANEPRPLVPRRPRPSACREGRRTR